MLILLKYWQIAVGSIAAFGLSWLLHTIDVDRIEVAKRAAIEQLKIECMAQQNALKEKNDDLQKNLAINAANAVKYKRMSSRCILPATGSSQPATGGAGHAEANGISSDWLRDFALQCNNYRSEVIACGGLQ